VGFQTIDAHSIFVSAIYAAALREDSRA